MKDASPMRETSSREKPWEWRKSGRRYQSSDPVFATRFAGTGAAASGLRDPVPDPAELDVILAQVSGRRVFEIREGKALFIEGQLPSGPLLLGAVHGFDPDKVYTAQIALLRGTVSEVRSDPYRLELFNAFLTKSRPAPVLIQEVPDPKPEDPNKTKFVTPKNADLEYFVRETALPLTAARVEVFDWTRAITPES